MMRLTIDQGNSLTKISLFNQGEMVLHAALNDAQLMPSLREIIHTHQPHSAIVSSVRADESILAGAFPPDAVLRIMSPALRFPFLIDYETKDTLGSDRLANAAGAMKLFPGKNCLTVDCGTCITYTLLINNSLCGGAIAPGIEMRFSALNHFTGKLPLITFGQQWPEITGKSTSGSILSGVIRGIVAETDEMIKQFCSDFPDLTVILTGGSASFFEAHLKSSIFAAPYLTPEGLHEILLLNEA